MLLLQPLDEPAEALGRQTNNLDQIKNNEMEIFNTLKETAIIRIHDTDSYLSMLVMYTHFWCVSV